MKTFTLASLFLPESTLLPILTLAGLFLVMGLRKLAWSMITFVLFMAFSPAFDPLVEALFASMPWWFSLAFIAGLVLMFAGRFMRDVLVHVVGDLISSAMKAILTSPVALLLIVGALGLLWLSAA